MWKYGKILLVMLVLTLSGGKVSAQSTAYASASATIINSVGINGIAEKEIQLNINEPDNLGDLLMYLPKMQQLLQKNVESGNIVITAANEDVYSVTLPSDIIFHNSSGANYLKGDISISALEAGNMPIRMQMDLYAEGRALPGRYNSLPVDIIVNFN